MPPLREHVDDIVPLLQFFVQMHCATLGRSVPRVDPRVERALLTRRVVSEGWLAGSLAATSGVLALGCAVTRPVTKDAPLTFADVSVPEGRLVDRLYAEQRAPADSAAAE